MQLSIKILLGGVIAVSVAAAQADAKPRSIKIRSDGSATDVDYRTNKIKDRPRRGAEGGQGDDTVTPVDDGAIGTDPVSPESGGGDTQVSSLPPLDLSDMRLWNWQGLWHASEWDHAFSDVPWRFNRITQEASGDTIFKLDAMGAPELQAINQTAHKKGLWEVDVTLPNEASGLAIAPLWLYDKSSKDEIDFEFVGTKGLQVNIHSYSTGKHVQAPVMLAGTSGWSGRRVLFGIRTDIDAGRIDLLINGEVVHTYYRSVNPEAFPKTALKPVISMWPAKSGLGWAEAWLGKWAGEPTTMVVHGYRFSQ